MNRDMRKSTIAILVIQLVLGMPSTLLVNAETLSSTPSTIPQSHPQETSVDALNAILEEAPKPYPQFLPPTLEKATAPADANGDMTVDLRDFVILKTTFGQTGMNIPGDLNGDEQVTLADLNILKNNFGTTYDSIVITEDMTIEVIDHLIRVIREPEPGKNAVQKNVTTLDTQTGILTFNKREYGLDLPIAQTWSEASDAVSYTATLYEFVKKIEEASYQFEGFNSIEKKDLFEVLQKVQSFANIDYHTVFVRLNDHTGASQSHEYAVIGSRIYYIFNGSGMVGVRESYVDLQSGLISHNGKVYDKNDPAWATNFYSFVSQQLSLLTGLNPRDFKDSNNIVARERLINMLASRLTHDLSNGAIVLERTVNQLLVIAENAHYQLDLGTNALSVRTQGSDPWIEIPKTHVTDYERTVIEMIQIIDTLTLTLDTLTVEQEAQVKIDLDRLNELFQDELYAAGTLQEPTGPLSYAAAVDFHLQTVTFTVYAPDILKTTVVSYTDLLASVQNANGSWEDQDYRGDFAGYKTVLQEFIDIMKRDTQNLSAPAMVSFLMGLQYVADVHLDAIQLQNKFLELPAHLRQSVQDTFARLGFVESLENFLSHNAVVLMLDRGILYDEEGNRRDPQGLLHLYSNLDVILDYVDQISNAYKKHLVLDSIYQAHRGLVYELIGLYASQDGTSLDKFINFIEHRNAVHALPVLINESAHAAAIHEFMQATYFVRTADGIDPIEEFMLNSVGVFYDESGHLRDPQQFVDFIEGIVSLRAAYNQLDLSLRSELQSIWKRKINLDFSDGISMAEVGIMGRYGFLHDREGMIRQPQHVIQFWLGVFDLEEALLAAPDRDTLVSFLYQVSGIIIPGPQAPLEMTLVFLLDLHGFFFDVNVQPRNAVATVQAVRDIRNLFQLLQSHPNRLAIEQQIEQIAAADLDNGVDLQDMELLMFHLIHFDSNGDLVLNNQIIDL